MSYAPNALIQQVTDVVLIESVTISNQATVDITFPAGFDRYTINLINIVPIDNESELWMRFSVDSSVLSGASDYFWRQQNGYRHNGGSIGGTVDLNDSEINLVRTTANRSMGTGTGEAVSASIYINNPNQTTQPVSGRAQVEWVDAGSTSGDGQSFQDVYFFLRATPASRVDGVQFRADTGNLSTGTITVFGLTN